MMFTSLGRDFQFHLLTVVVNINFKSLKTQIIYFADSIFRPNHDVILKLLCGSACLGLHLWAHWNSIANQLLIITSSVMSKHDLVTQVNL